MRDPLCMERSLDLDGNPGLGFYILIFGILEENGP